MISKVIVFKPSGKYRDEYDMILSNLSNLDSDKDFLYELRVRKVSLYPGGYVVFVNGVEQYQVPMLIRIPEEK